MYDNTKYIHRHTNLSTKKDNLFKFCMTLPYNLVFSTGFRAAIRIRDSGGARRDRIFLAH